MARISGVDLPRDKRCEIALTYIFGVGLSTSAAICEKVGISRDTKIRELTDEEVAHIREYIDQNVIVEGELRREFQQSIRRKIDIQSYQGRRHTLGLPVRGQNTRTNARTRKGPTEAVAGKKKKVGKKG